MNRPRLIFINRVYRPSGEATAQLLTDLAEGLAERNWKVQVIAAGEESALHGGVTVHRTGPGERHGGLLSRARNYFHFLRSARRLVKQLAQPGDIVVLMTDPPLLAAVATGTAIRRGARVIQWIQDIYPEIVPQHYGAWAGWPLLPLKGWRNRAWRAAALCLPVGEDMRALVAAQGVAGQKLLVSPNWAPRELDLLPSPAELADFHRTQNVPAGFIVGYSGNLGRVHDFQTVVSAATILARDPAFSCTFRFTASGPQLKFVASAGAAGGLSNLQLLPPAPRAQLPLNLGVAQAHLVTLRPGFESLVNPSKVAGILAAARPVLFVGPPECALAEFIRREQVGSVVSPGDTGQLVSIIRAWAAHDGALAASLGANARNAYERHFSLQAALDHWEALLSSPELGRPA